MIDDLRQHVDAMRALVDDLPVRSLAGVGPIVDALDRLDAVLAIYRPPAEGETMVTLRRHREEVGAR